MSVQDKPAYSAGVGHPGRAQIAERTLRTDRWWVSPLLYAHLLHGLGALRHRPDGHRSGTTSSPSSTTCRRSPRRACPRPACPGSATFGTWFGDFPPFVPFALLTLPFLLGFRLTCYYYRKAYYRSFWLSPPACAVAEPHAKYTGERRFPLILQNVHRYFFYAAVVVSLINTYDAIARVPRQGRRLRHRARHGDHGRQRRPALGVHRVLPLLPHIIGGRLKHFSEHPVRYRAWMQVVQAQHPPHAARLDDAGDPRRHRRLHRAGRPRARSTT